MQAAVFSGEMHLDVLFLFSCFNLDFSQDYSFNGEHVIKQNLIKNNVNF